MKVEYVAVDDTWITVCSNHVDDDKDMVHDDVVVDRSISFGIDHNTGVTRITQYFHEDEDLDSRTIHIPTHMVDDLAEALTDD